MILARLLRRCFSIPSFFALFFQLFVVKICYEMCGIMALWNKVRVPMEALFVCEPLLKHFNRSKKKWHHVAFTGWHQDARPGRVWPKMADNTGVIPAVKLEYMATSVWCLSMKKNMYSVPFSSKVIFIFFLPSTR